MIIDLCVEHKLINFSELNQFEKQKQKMIRHLFFDCDISIY